MRTESQILAEIKRASTARDAAERDLRRHCNRLERLYEDLKKAVKAKRSAEERLNWYDDLLRTLHNELGNSIEEE